MDPPQLIVMIAGAAKLVMDIHSSPSGHNPTFGCHHLREFDGQCYWYSTNSRQLQRQIAVGLALDGTVLLVTVVCAPAVPALRTADLSNVDENAVDVIHQAVEDVYDAYIRYVAVESASR